MINQRHCLKLILSEIRYQSKSSISVVYTARRDGDEWNIIQIMISLHCWTRRSSSTTDIHSGFKNASLLSVGFPPTPIFHATSHIKNHWPSWFTNIGQKGCNELCRVHAVTRNSAYIRSKSNPASFREIAIRPCSTQNPVKNSLIIALEAMITFSHLFDIEIDFSLCRLQSVNGIPNVSISWYSKLTCASNHHNRRYAISIAKKNIHNVPYHVLV